jgi:hypothetical protein
MPFGYIGQNQTKQLVKNSGVLSSFDVSHLEKQGHTGGSLELISEQTSDGSSATIDFLDIKENVYDVHLLTYNNVGATGADYDSVLIRLYESGVLETGSVYQWANQRIRANGGVNEYKSTVSSTLPVHNNGVSNSNYEKINSYVYLYNLGNTNKYSFATWQTAQIPSYSESQIFSTNFGGGVLPQASVVDGIRLYDTQATGTSVIKTGSNFKLYGVKQI